MTSKYNGVGSAPLNITINNIKYFISLCVSDNVFPNTYLASIKIIIKEYNYKYIPLYTEMIAEAFNLLSAKWLSKKLEPR